MTETKAPVAEAEEVILPQPIDLNEEKYRYVRFDRIKETFFEASMPKDTLCRVLNCHGKTVPKSLRARLVEFCPKKPDEDESRWLVRYPKGSTYRVRTSNLLPVLEHHKGVVIVASETKDYRKTAISQTCQEDHFVEIGCDFGILVDNVDCLSKVGIDKSETSIQIARQRYPDEHFILGDIFENLEIEVKYPLVVAIDINGNRALPAVVRCVQLVLDKWHPRLVVVKSRELYGQL